MDNKTEVKEIGVMDTLYCLLEGYEIPIKDINGSNQKFITINKQKILLNTENRPYYQWNLTMLKSLLTILVASRHGISVGYLIETDNYKHIFYWGCNDYHFIYPDDLKTCWEYSKAHSSIIMNANVFN